MSRRAHPLKQAALDGTFDWDLLLARANAVDGAAFLRFLTEVTPPLRGLIGARGRGLPPDLHKDILQKVWLEIHLKRQSWTPGHPLRPWLYAVARHRAIDAFRRRGHRLHLPREDVAEILVAKADPTPLAAHDAVRMLGMIDARSAAPVRAPQLQGHSTEDAARGLSAGAARVARHRAMKCLPEPAERMEMTDRPSTKDLIRRLAAAPPPARLSVRGAAPLMLDAVALPWACS